MSFHVYILRSQTTGRYYIGQTKDVQERLAYHNANYSKSLKNRGPWQLIHTESYAHMGWHPFLLTGTVCHLMAVYLYVLPHRA